MSTPPPVQVVSNTSPLINLASVGLLDLLPKLYRRVLIPEAVWHEVVILGAGQPGANELAQAAWADVVKPHNRDLVTALQRELDAGES
jgi:predicted nucleic acid-binding protein